MSRLCRVTTELLEDGIVTYAQTCADEKVDWAGAVIAVLHDWQIEAVLMRILHDRMEDIFLSCEKPDDLKKHDQWLAAAREIISSCDERRFSKDVDVYLKWEADIRSGKAFE